MWMVVMMLDFQEENDWLETEHRRNIESQFVNILNLGPALGLREMLMMVVLCDIAVYMRRHA
eukprot:4116964-Karenia_brevis.AAC.1